MKAVRVQLSGIIVRDPRPPLPKTNQFKTVHLWGKDDNLSLVRDGKNGETPEPYFDTR